MMLLPTILLSLTAQTAWAEQTTVSLSGNATDGYYINMPAKGSATSFNDAAVLTLDGSIKTFKLYDNGGKSGNYSKDYNGYLVINAPSNYYIHFAGNLDQLGGGATKLTVYDNNTGYNDGYDILYYQTGSQLDVDETSTGSAITVWHKTASSFEAFEDTGFDFTVTLIEKGAYDDLYAEVSSDGKAMTLKCTTTSSATTNASAGRYKYKFIRSGFNWASEFTTDSKSAITTVNVDASCANYTGTNLEELFSFFTSLTTINGLSNLRTANVKRMNNMFDHCSKLTMVDLGTWDTRSVAENRMGNMFEYCSSLTAIIVGPNWKTAENSRYMFEYCNSLVGGAGTQCPENFYEEYDWTYAHVDGGTANPGFLTADWAGSGTADDPYIINCKAHLDLLALRVNTGNDYYGKYFKLGADITYDNTKENNFTPIGDESHAFFGTFDGDGKTISGLNINLPETDYVGLFRKAFSATIKGVKLDNSTIKGKGYVGGIVGIGSISTTIQNCAVTSTVTVSGTSTQVGGIVGMYATVSGCTSAADVSGTQDVGGIIGLGDNSTIDHCLYTGSSVTASNRSGAITGKGASLTANYYTADLACKGANGADEDGARKALTITLPTNVVLSGAATTYGVSGITAYDNNNIVRYNNTYYAVAGESITLSYTGALAEGYAARYTVNNEAISGNTFTMPAANPTTIAVTTADVWGVTGGAADGSEEKPYIIKTTEGLDLLAQKVSAGNNYNQKYFKLGADITYTHLADGADGAATENNYTAISPFEGYFDGNDKTISGIRIYKDGSSYTDSNQGLFGRIGQYAEVKNITLADTRITAANYSGGIVGENGGGKIADCHVTNTVEILANSNGRNHGGIVGCNDNGTVSGCVSEATLTNVSGFNYGGIAASNDGTLENNFVIGATIPAAAYGNSHGAIVGQNNNGTLKNNYYTACTVAGVENATNVGVGLDSNNQPVGDVIANNGAVFDVLWGTAAGADGSEAKPYIIKTTAGLDLLAQRVNAGNRYEGKFFKLDADIEYDKNTENNFTPIGDNNHYFMGAFDGNGKTISGININNSSAYNQGIFGRVDGTVKNLIISNCSIEGYQKIGAIAGTLELHGIIENCSVGDNVTLSGCFYIGGIAGVSEEGKIKGCTSAATITGVRDDAGSLGGIVGTTATSSDPSELTDNLFTGTITGALKEYIGAIVGYKVNGTLTNNVHTSTLGGIGAEGSKTGADGAGARKAVVISAATGVTIAATGEATTYNVSGITAYDGNNVLGYDGKLYLDANTTTVKLNISYAAPEGYAITGYTDGNGNALTANNDGTYTLTMTDAAPTITATSADVWGVAAGADGTSEATAYTITTPAGLDLLAKMVNAGNGYEDTYFKLGGNITYNRNTENNFTPIGKQSHPFRGTFDGKEKTISGLNINLSTTNYVGLFGITNDATIKNVKLDNSTIKGRNDVGGIVGYGSSSYTTVENCAVTINVSVTGAYRVGGIVGRYATVRGCTSAAVVSGDYINVGGIIGIGEFTTIERCLYTGSSVTAENNKGAITGSRVNTSMIANYYTQATIGGCDGSDVDGARKAVEIGTVEGVTITPTGKATVYDVSGITAYAGNNILGYGGKLYAGANEAVKFSIAYTAPDGYVPTGYTDGNGNALTANDDGTYTLTMTDAAPTIKPTTADVWGIAAGADGSATKPYTITTTIGLDYLAKRVNAGNDYSDKYFKLGADITYTHLAADAAGADTENNFTAIGENGHSFYGHFDGDGKTISGIRIYKSDGARYQGLFGHIMAPAVVENLTLTDTRITAGYYTGGIVGKNDGGQVINSHVTNTVEILGIGEDDSNHGGIVGTNVNYDENVGTVSGCISEATLTSVSGSVYGGIAGLNHGTLENNFVIGATIPAATDESGAIVGWNSKGTLKNNYYTACTVAGVENATDVGSNNADVAANDGALSVHQITLAEGVKDVTFDTSAKVYSYDSKDYYAQGKSVKFTYSGTPATDYIFGGINAGEGVTGTLSGNTYTMTMPARDVTASTAWKKLLTNTDITIAEIADQTCTGSEIKPAITVKDGTTVITDQCDFAFTDNTAVGTATVTITAKTASNGYAGETTMTFDILREMSGLFADGNQWTGYVAQEDLTLPDGLTAYTISALGETTATATTLDYIPQGEPVLLCRSDKTSNLYRARAGNGTAPATNLLQAASSTNQPKAYQDFVLYKDAFVLTSGGTLATGKVFLPMTSGSGSRAATRSIVTDDGETTGIINTKSHELSGDDWYSMDGRKLNGKPTRKGIYIQNGKKVVVK